MTELVGDEERARLVQHLRQAMAQVDDVVVGKHREVRLAFIALLSGGHLLLDDLPGMGKTTLAKALAATVDLRFHRVQFTSDLTPSDILGMSVFEGVGQSGGMRFHAGPIFSNLFLADEINRASPRTQSALLEAMAEDQVTIDGHTYALPSPFFVIATQNPVDMAGTFPLPDSQLDRFLFRTAMGYPDAQTEMRLLAGDAGKSQLAKLSQSMDLGQVMALRQMSQDVHVSPAVLEYVLSLVEASRTHPAVRVGLSPRAGIALVGAARANALMQGRTHVIPDDVKGLFEPLAAHRLVPSGYADPARRTEIASEILGSVRVP